MAAGYYQKLLEDQPSIYYAIVAVCLFDRFVRLVRIAWSGPLSKARMKIVGSDIIESNVEFSGRWKPYPGSFVLFIFSEKSNFWQSHPKRCPQQASPKEESEINVNGSFKSHPRPSVDAIIQRSSRLQAHLLYL